MRQCQEQTWEKLSRPWVASFGQRLLVKQMEQFHDFFLIFEDLINKIEASEVSNRDGTYSFTVTARSMS